MDYFHYLDNLAGYNLFIDGRTVCRQGYFLETRPAEADRLKRLLAQWEEDVKPTR